MAFVPKKTKQKIKSCYKSLYMTEDLAEKLNQIAAQNDTSFNTVVLSIIEDFFLREEKDSEN